MISAVLLIEAGILLGYVPLTALGISCSVLGATAISLPKEIGVSDTVKAILQGATLTTEALLNDIESAGIKISRLQKEVVYLSPEALVSNAHVGLSPRYLPPRDGLIAAYIPFRPLDPSTSVETMLQAPRKLVGNDQNGLVVLPIGASIAGIPEITDSGADLEGALRKVLVDSGICSSLTAIELESMFILELERVKFRNESSQYSRILGSMPVSLAACVCAAVSKEPVIVLDERTDGSRIVAMLRVG